MELTRRFPPPRSAVGFSDGSAQGVHELPRRYYQRRGGEMSRISGDQAVCLARDRYLVKWYIGGIRYYRGCGARGNMGAFVLQELQYRLNVIPGKAKLGAEKDVSVFEQNPTVHKYSDLLVQNGIED